MKNRLAFLILGLLSGCLAIGFAQADVGNVTQSGSITGTGVQPWLTLNGQGSCVVVLGGTFTGVTIVPQTSGDGGSTQQTASNVGSGSLSSVGTYWGPIVGVSNGLSLFRLNVTAYTSGTVNYVVTCTPAGGTNSITGSVSIIGTVPVSLPTCATTLPCVQVSSLPGPALTSNPGGVVLVQNVQANASPLPSFTTNPVVVEGQVLTNGSIIFRPTPDTLATPVAISGAATTLLYSGTAGQYTTVYLIAMESTGTNSGTQQWEWGTGSTCGTNTVGWFPSSVAFTGASGNLMPLYPGGAGFTATGGQTLGPIGPGFTLPLIGANVCILTTGTNAFKAWGIFATSQVAP